MVCLDADGEVVRPALLWNDTRSAGAADDLVAELGAAAWVDAVGSVPVAAFTVTKLRWLAEHEPEHAARTAAVCLPHDWLTWRLRGTGDLDDLTTDRSDASGTGYFDACTNEYRRDLLVLALGRDVLPADRARAARPLSARGALHDRAGRGRQRRRRARRRRRRRRDRVARHVGHRVHPQRGAAVRPRPARSPGSPISPAPSSRSCARSTPPACSTRRPRCSASTTNGSATSRSPPNRARRASRSCRTSRASAPRTCRTRPAASSASPTPTPRRGNLARAAVEGMLCGLADAVDALAAHGKRGRADPARRRRRPLRSGAGDRAHGVRRARRGATTGRVRRRRRGPSGGVGALGRRRTAAVADRRRHRRTRRAAPRRACARGTTRPPHTHWTSSGDHRAGAPTRPADVRNRNLALVLRSVVQEPASRADVVGDHRAHQGRGVEPRRGPHGAAAARRGRTRGDRSRTTAATAAAPPARADRRRARGERRLRGRGAHDARGRRGRRPSRRRRRARAARCPTSSATLPSAWRDVTRPRDRR